MWASSGYGNLALILTLQNLGVWVLVVLGLCWDAGHMLIVYGIIYLATGLSGLLATFKLSGKLGFAKLPFQICILLASIQIHYHNVGLETKDPVAAMSLAIGTSSMQILLVRPPSWMHAAAPDFQFMLQITNQVPQEGRLWTYNISRQLLFCILWLESGPYGCPTGSGLHLLFFLFRRVMGSQISDLRQSQFTAQFIIIKTK